MSGGSTKQTQKMELPQWQEDFVRFIQDRARRGSEIGFAPYMGPTVAARSQGQINAGNNINNAAAALGLQQSTSTLPPPETFAGGVQGYSSYPLYEQQMKELQKMNPEQYGLLAAMNPGVPK
jgi:hypothetical protein